MSTVPIERIHRQIFVIRGIKVMLSSDLAELYGVEVKVLNQAVKRNSERFPNDFMFQLTRKEFEILKSHPSWRDFVKTRVCHGASLVLIRVISWFVLLWDGIGDPRNHTNQHEQKPTVIRVSTQSLKHGEEWEFCKRPLSLFLNAFAEAKSAQLLDEVRT